MRGLLITGTDTGIGKTFVACALARAIAPYRRVDVLKPAETGCAPRGKELIPDDALRLREAARSTSALEIICPYRFEEPLAPAIAARRAGCPIDPKVVRRCYDVLAREADVVIVESAGGLLVPLVESWSFADLARDLDLEVVIVVGSRLGALNQTLLTIEVARRRGLRLVGYVVNRLEAGTDLARDTNEEALELLTDIPRLASVSWSPADGPSELGVPLANALGLLEI